MSLEQCQRWRSAGLEAVTVSVNVSKRSLLDHALLTIGTAGGLEPPAGRFSSRSPKPWIVADLPRSAGRARRVRAMGATIAISMIGTGYSQPSLSQLQQLPVDEIKIDRSFVTRMETDRQDAVLVHSIIDLGRNLGLRVTAEGVENWRTSRGLGAARLRLRPGFHVGGRWWRGMARGTSHMPDPPRLSGVQL